ncbi:hypothetical protein GCM10009839_66730 [Catenulispora yoronensis]|uniref:Integron gene cassette protein n=1 Tax=Catenulispora yoronensis TaxID=450799 RepID=A0ABN2V4C6_9ACTN
MHKLRTVLRLSVGLPIFWLAYTLSSSGFFGAQRGTPTMRTRILLGMLALAVPASFVAAWLAFCASGLRSSGVAGVLCSVVGSGIVAYLTSVGGRLLVFTQDPRSR